jgi:hypothetical protein
MEALRTVPAVPDEHPAGGMDGTKGRTFRDHWSYGVFFTDAEEFTLHNQEHWENGFAKAADWTEEGWQWTSGA